jgi:hypothetical protein
VTPNTTSRFFAQKVISGVLPGTIPSLFTLNEMEVSLAEATCNMDGINRLILPMPAGFAAGDRMGFPVKVLG